MDTCAVIKYLSVTYPQKGILFIDKIIDSESIISFITEIELLAWAPPEESDLNVYKKFISDSSVIKINDDIIQHAILLRKNQKLKIPDAIIAATAMANNYTLISDNEKDFGKVPRLKFINPSKMF